MTLLVTAMTIILSTFTVTIRAWGNGTALLEDLHHGDLVMEQLVSALRSAAYFDNRPDKYGFHLKDRSYGSYPGDLISWVVSGTAFMPPDSELANGLHRIVVSIEDNEDGDASVAVRAFPHLAEIDDEDEDPWFVSSVVKGIDCRVYVMEEDEEESEGDWEDEWEDTNSIPSIVEITLYADPLEEFGDPVEIKRLVRIPVAPKTVKTITIESRGSESTDTGGKNRSGSSQAAGTSKESKVGIRR